jgi:hypothetical protein
MLVGAALAAVLVACGGARPTSSPGGSGGRAPGQPGGNAGATSSSGQPMTDEDTKLTTELRDIVGDSLVAERHGQFGLAAPEILPSDGGATPFAHFLRVRYPARSASQTVVRDTGAPSGGAQAYLRYDGGPLDALILGYYVRFPVGFDFVKGGKLPGLFGGTVTSGQHIPDGTDGFSTRFMWRAGGVGEVYAYLPSSVVHGTSIGRGSWTFPTGRWTKVEQEVRLNDPAGSDGEIAVWIDGKMVLDVAGLRFRTVSGLALDGVFFSTFFGGDDPHWATPVDQYVDFGGFTVRPAPG